MSVNKVQSINTTAEVAEVMSNLSDRHLPAGERCFRRRICPEPSRTDPGAAQNMCRTVIMKKNDVVLPGRNFVFAPCAAARGFFILREVML